LKNARPKSSVRVAPLRTRLAEAEETLRAIRAGEVDAVVVAGKEGPQVFTLEGEGYAYRTLIESMHEGALTLTNKGDILYANQCFAEIIKSPLEQVTGSSFRRFLSAKDRSALRPLLKSAGKSGSKIQVQLLADDGSKIPVQISLCPLARQDSGCTAIIGMVVTNMTELRQNETLLRALTCRGVAAQEAERRHVARELHDNITQLLCAVLIRSQTLIDKLSSHDGIAKKEAIKLRTLLCQAAEEVERISRNLRPGVLDQLGLDFVLHGNCAEFAARTGVSVKLTCTELTARLPADTELAIYRIFQKALENVEQHAHARHVLVRLKKKKDRVELTIKDDGIGFDTKHQANRSQASDSLDLLGMRERATCVGGDFIIKSVCGSGTEIKVLIPLPPTRLRRTN